MQVSKEDLSSFVSFSSPISWYYPSWVISLLPPPLCPAVCENCMEVDLTAVSIIIIVDICITLGLLMVVYYWSKKRKAKAKPVTRGTGTGGRPRGQNKERPPPVPNPDYEPIRKGQRDLYSGLNQRAV